MTKDTEISRLENKIKLSLLQAEKRLVEIEVTVTELKELRDRLKDFDPTVLQPLFSELPELKQRLEDLEDLIMIESIGVDEVKKMMEEVKAKLEQPAQPPQPTVSAEIESRISSLEGLKEKLSTIDELQKKISSLEELKQQVKNISSELSSFETEFTKLKTIAPSVRLGADFQLLSAKIDNLKNIVDDLLTRKVELDLKIEEVGKNVAIIQSRGFGGIPEEVKREIDNLKKDSGVVSYRLDSLEKVVREFSGGLSKVEPVTQKFEGPEDERQIKITVSALGKELETKLEEFKFIEDEIKRLSNRIEMIYTTIDKRLDRIKDVEKRFLEISGAIEYLNEEISKTRTEVLEKAEKAELEERYLTLDQKITEFFSVLNNLSRKIDENRIMILDRIRKEELPDLLKRIYGELPAATNIKMESMKIDELQKTINNFRSELQNKILFLDKSYAKQFEKIEKMKEEFEERLKERGEPTMPADTLNLQLTELLNKIIILENRIGTLEKIIRETRALQPIILE